MVVTTAVQKRLKKEAEAEIPKARIIKITDAISKYIFVFFGMTGLPLAILLCVNTKLDYLVIPFWLMWALVPSFSIYLIMGLITKKPRAKRRQLIDEKTLQFAEKRRIDIEERQFFYTSAEWIIIRNKVIKEKGRNCAQCNRYIQRDEDLTVDHVKPRSLYPHLSLNEDNLQVLCRRCNSRKGNREYY